MSVAALNAPLARVTPLGIGFWDSVSARVVSAGLQVGVWPAGQEHRRIETLSNGQGIFCAQCLPGLRDQEYGSGDADYWAGSGLHARSFVIGVRDSGGSFLPMRLGAQLPVRGLFVPGCGSPLLGSASSAYVPLFSAPSRRLPGGVAAVYAQLAVPGDSGSTTPAAWCVAEAWIAGELVASGMADAGGALLLAFAYPAPPLAASSPAEPWSLYQSNWQVELRLRYSAQADPTQAPDYCRAMQQPEVQAIDGLSPLTPMPAQTLFYGQALVFRSSASPRGELLLAT
jgi:hypothetical protein